jgi:hypothetical protein
VVEGRLRLLIRDERPEQGRYDYRERDCPPEGVAVVEVER